jgi:hypothetical protein
MRVQKPLMLARRRQLCAEAPLLARPAPPALPLRDADIYDLREERRGFAEAQATLTPPRRVE